jgi:hypothetical protein
MIEFSFSCVACAFGFPLVNDSILQQAIYQAQLTVGTSIRNPSSCHLPWSAGSRSAHSQRSISSHCPCCSSPKQSRSLFELGLVETGPASRARTCFLGGVVTLMMADKGLKIHMAICTDVEGSLASRYAYSCVPSDRSHGALFNHSGGWPLGSQYNNPASI